MKNRLAISMILIVMLSMIIATSFTPSSVLATPTVGANTNITNESHGQDEPNIAINPLHNTLQPKDIHVAVGVNDYRGGNSVVSLYTSTDLTTWTYHTVFKPNYNAYGNPVLAYDSYGNLYYAYMAFQVDSSGNPYNAAIYVSKSPDEGLTWPFYIRVSSLGVGTDPYNDRPWLTIDKSNNIYVTWTLWHGLGASCTGSDIMFARSTNLALSFSTPIRLSMDSTINHDQVQWSQVVAGSSGKVYVSWRRMGFSGFTRAILMAKSGNYGSSFGAETVVIQYPNFDSADYRYSGDDPATCTWPHLACGPEGNLYIAWHTYVSSGDRDLNFIRSTDGGVSWSTKITIASNSKDQFWPVLAISPSGRIDVVWYDRRDDVNNQLINLYYTNSTDKGVTFDPNIVKVTTATSDTTVLPHVGFGRYFGDYIDLADTSDGAALAVWTDTRTGNQEIFISTISFPTVPAGYSAAIIGWDYVQGGQVAVPISMDGVSTGYSTPHNFTGLTGTHNFTVPYADNAGHPFSDWSTGWTENTVTVSSSGTYIANYRAGYSATIWGWDYVYGWAQPVPITKDGVSTGYSTPHIFTNLTGTHTFTVPSTNSAGHPFSEWSTGWTDRTITVSSAGVYTARYRAGYSVTIWSWCAINGWLSSPITKDGVATGYSTPHIFTGLTGTHNFTVPSTDANGHPFYDWSTGATGTTITVSSAGVYTARYKPKPTVTSFTVSPNPLSPNGDGVKDNTTIKATFNLAMKWNLQIRNSSGATLRTWTGTGTSLSVVWNGKNSTGFKVPDGVYTVRLSGKDVLNVAFTTKTTTVTVDTKRPTVSGVSIYPTSFKPKSAQTTRLNYTLSESCYVTIKIYNSTGALKITLLNNVLQASGLHSIVWNGKYSSNVIVPPGTYTIKIWVVDKAGNKALTYPIIKTVTVL